MGGDLGASVPTVGPDDRQLPNIVPMSPDGEWTTYVPWKVEEDDGEVTIERGFDRICLIGFDRSDRPHQVAWHRATAEFIVRCVNSHHELLEAARAAMIWVAIQTGDDPLRHPKSIQNAKDDLAALVAAIARAEGRSA